MSDKDLLSSIQELESPKKDAGLLASIKDIENEKASALRTNIFASTPIPPEQATKQWQISQQTKIPVEVVRTQENQIKQMTELNSFNYDDLVNNFPKTAAQLADSSKTAAIRDDVSNLSYFEKIVGSVSQEYRSSQENVAQSDLFIKQMLSDVSGNEKYRLTPIEENKLALINESQGQRKDYGLGFVSSIPSYTAATIPTIASTLPATLGGAAVGAGLGLVATRNPLGASLGASIGSKAGTALSVGKLETGLAYQELRGLVDESGKPIEKTIAAGGAIATGIVNGLLELVPFGETKNQITKNFSKEGVKQLIKGGVGREYLKNIGRLAIAEGAAEGLQELSSVTFGEAAKAISTGDFKLLGMKDASDAEGFTKFLSDSTDRILESAKAGAGGGIGLGMGTGAISAAQQLRSKNRQDKEDQQIIQDVVNRAKNSNILKRSPELFKEVTKDTLGEQSVYIPAEQIQTFFQSRTPQELEAINAALPDIKDQLQEALDIGGNVVLKGNDVAAALETHPELSGLQEFMKLSPESFSDLEAQDAFLQNVVPITHAEEKLGKAKAEQNLVKKNIEHQILNLGMPYRDAKEYINLIGSFYDTQVSRYGDKEARKIVDSYLGSLEAKGAQFKPQPFQQINKIEDLDLFLDKVRKPIKERKAGKPLLKMLKEKGGVQLGSNLAGELNALGLTPKTALGLFKKEGGIGDVDNIPASEFKAQFPHIEGKTEGEYIDRQHMLDLLAQEVGGKDISIAENPEQEQIKDFLEQLDNLGIDIKTATNEEIKKAVNEFESQTFNQAKDQTQTEAFKKWFGDSKVVDEKGEPLVVYHGTGEDISEFQTTSSKPSFAAAGNFGKTKNIMAGKTYGTGTFFTDNKAVANSYVKSGSEVIYPTYLSIKNPLVVDFADRIWSQGNDDVIVKLKDGTDERFSDLIEGGEDGFSTDDVARYARQNGFDGVIISNAIDRGPSGRYATPEANKPSTIYVAFEPTQIKSAIGNQGTFDPESGNIYYQSAPTFYSANKFKEQTFSQGEITPQGQTQFIGQKPIISLFEKSDRSTLLHELGHVFLQMRSDLAKLPNMSEEFIKDWQITEKWLDIKNGVITREAHEKFARGFEAYLRDGKAPSIALRDAFRRFKAWLTRIYQDVLQLDVKLTDDVRGMFDRMLATDEAIESLRNNPIFATDDKVLELLTEKERADYIKLSDKTKEKAKEKLLTKSLKQKERENKKFYKEEKARVKEEVDSEMSQDRTFRAMHFLKTGKILGQETPEGLKGYKLSRQDVKDNYDNEFVKYLPNEIFGKDGAPVDMVAEEFGFKDGGEMLYALANIKDFKTELKKATNDEMIRRYGDMLFDGTIEEEAINASENEAAANKILYELNAINRKVRTYVETKEAYKQKAKEIIAQKQIKDATQTNTFYLNEIKAAREAGKAFGKKDYEKAVEWKKKQLLNHYLFRESLALKQEIQKAARSYARYKRKPTAGKVVLEEDYRQKVINLLQDFGLAKKTEDYQKTDIENLEAWKQEQINAGALGLVEFPEIANFQDKDQIQNLTTDEFRTLDDAIQNLATVARNSRLLEVNGKKQELDSIVDSIIEQVNTNIKKDKPELEDPTDKERLVQAFDSFSSSLIKTSQTTLKIDGEKHLGKFYNYFEKDLNQAELVKNEMSDESYAKLDAIYDKHFGGYKISNKRTYFDSVGKSYSKQAVLAFALNWGNEVNRMRVRDGFNYSDAQVTSIISSLSKNELEFVQDIWDLINEYWPAIEKTEKKLFGIAPKKQKSNPIEITSSDGEKVSLRGGYYPLAYSQEANFKSDTAEDLKNVLLGTGFDKVNFHKSFTKERTEQKVSKKITLDLNPLSKHLTQVITDISMKPAAWNAYRIINNRKLKSALVKKIGISEYKQLQSWVYDMYGRTLVQEGFLGKFAGLSRSITTTYAMGFKVATALIQVTGLLQSVVKLGYKNTGLGLWKALGNGNPASINQAAKLAFAKSKILKDRSTTMTRDIYEVINRLQKANKIQKNIAKFAFLATTKAQMLVDIPTWYGGYYKGLKDFNGDDAKAVELADRLLIETQGSSYKQSRSSIERDESAIARAFTVFYNYMNVKLNLIAGSYRGSDFKKPKDVAKFASDFLLLFAADALMTEFLRTGVSNLLSGRDGDDEEDKALHYANLVGGSIASTIPGASQIYSGLSGYSYAPSGFKGVEIVGKGVSRIGKELAHAVSEDQEADLLEAMRGINDTLAIFAVGGGGQIDIFLRALEEEEKGNNPSAVDFILKPKK